MSEESDAIRAEITAAHETEARLDMVPERRDGELDVAYAIRQLEYGAGVAYTLASDNLRLAELVAARPESLSARVEALEREIRAKG